MSNNAVALYNFAIGNEKVKKETNLLGIKFRVEEVARNNTCCNICYGTITETDVNDAVFSIYAERRAK